MAMRSAPRMTPEMWEVLRRQMVQETEAFLEYGLRHPEKQIMIPTMEVGRGGWSAAFASTFWSQVLATS